MKKRKFNYNHIIRRRKYPDWLMPETIDLLKYALITACIAAAAIWGITK